PPGPSRPPAPTGPTGPTAPTSPSGPTGPTSPPGPQWTSAGLPGRRFGGLPGSGGRTLGCLLRRGRNLFRFLGGRHLAELGLDLFGGRGREHVQHQRIGV